MKGKLELYRQVMSTYGIDAQKWMLVEECGELLNAISKFQRGRSMKDEVITELADVSIMVEQMALLFGWKEFENEKGRKLNRLQQRLETCSILNSAKTPREAE